MEAGPEGEERIGQLKLILRREGGRFCVQVSWVQTVGRSHNISAEQKNWQWLGENNRKKVFLMLKDKRFCDCDKFKRHTGTNLASPLKTGLHDPSRLRVLRDRKIRMTHTSHRLHLPQPCDKVPSITSHWPRLIYFATVTQTQRTHTHTRQRQLNSQ